MEYQEAKLRSYYVYYGSKIKILNKSDPVKKEEKKMDKELENLWIEKVKVLCNEIWITAKI